MTRSGRLDALHLLVSDALHDLSKNFTSGMKLTFVARHPDFPERYVLVSEDDMAELAALLIRADDKGKK